MNPRDRVRSIVDADQIAASEWASTRASAAVWNVLGTTRPGQREIEAARNLACGRASQRAHTMLTSGNGQRRRRRPSATSTRVLAKGDGVATASGLLGRAVVAGPAFWTTTTASVGVRRPASTGWSAGTTPPTSA